MHLGVLLKIIVLVVLSTFPAPQVQTYHHRVHKYKTEDCFETKNTINANPYAAVLAFHSEICLPNIGPRQALIKTNVQLSAIFHNAGQNRLWYPPNIAPTFEAISRDFWLGSLLFAHL
jgi:hypothetical protein